MLNKELYNEMERRHSLKLRIQFELGSFIGRKFLKSRGVIRKNLSPLLLDIGVGNNYKKGWTHLDFYQLPISYNIKNYLRYYFENRKNRPEIECDLRYPLNCRDNIVDGIYCSHTIEHLLPNHAIQLLKEMYRILKPGGYARIIVPDFGIAFSLYIENLPLRPEVSCDAIMAYAQNSQHLSTWNEGYLKYILGECGFVNVQKVEYGIGGVDKRLIKDDAVRKDFSLVVEAMKPPAL